MRYLSLCLSIGAVVAISVLTSSALMAQGYAEQSFADRTPIKSNGFVATHPMDALTPDEVKLAVSLLSKAGYVDKSTLYPTITLLEAPKAVILKWKPGQPFTRKAFVVSRVKNKTYETVGN